MGLTGVRYALRLARRTPFLTIVVLLMLAGGIAVTTAVFGLVNAVWLRPLPYPHAARLVVVNQLHPRLGFASFVTPAAYAAWRETDGWAEAVGAFTERAFALGRRGLRAERVRGVRVAPDLLRLLGARPLAGRSLLARAAAAGAGAVALVSERFWRRRCLASPATVGSTVRLDGVETTIVGVLPYSFRLFNSGFDVFVPLPDAPADATARSLLVVARLAPGISREAAAARLAALESGGAAAARGDDPGWTPILRPLGAVMWGEARPAFLLLLAAACLLLALISANVANLLLARSEERRHEFAVRLALGAGRSGIVCQLLTEGLLLAMTSGILAFLLCVWAHRLLLASVPEITDLQIDVRVFAFATLVSILTGLVFGSLPALSVLRREVEGSLRSDRAGGHRKRSGRILAVAQVAAATALLICCGLLLRAAFGIRATDPGFATDRLLTTSISLPSATYSSTGRRIAFYRHLTARVAAMPGVVSAGLGTAPPLDGNVSTVRLEIEGRPPTGQAMRASRNAIDGGYLRTLGLALRAGEVFRDGDTTSVVINQAMARSLWTSEARAVGARVRIADGPWWRVAGVVSDARQILTAPAAPEIYLPLQIEPPTVASLVVRTTTDPTAVAAGVGAAVRDLDLDVPVSGVRPMATIIDGYLPAPFLAAFLALAAIGLFFSALGLYAVVAFQVARRTREFGIRLALGADARRILRQILSEGLWLTGAGLVLGAGAGLWLGSLLAHRLFPIDVADPLVGGTVAGLLALVSIAACAVPGRRAGRIEPAVALRRE